MYDWAEQYLDQAIAFTKYLNQEFPGSLGYIQILNRERFLSLSPKANKNMVYDWNIIIVLYGQKKIVQHIQSDIKSRCKPFVASNIFLTESKVKILFKMPKFIIDIIEKSVKVSVADLKELFAFYRGKPSNIAIKNLVYSDRTDDISNVPLDVEADKKGIIWLAPLIPQTCKDLQNFISIIEPVFKKYGIAFSISLTAFYGYCFDGTIPLFFNREDKAQEMKARECHHELLTVCIEHVHSLPIGDTEHGTPDGAFPAS